MPGKDFFRAVAAGLGGVVLGLLFLWALLSRVVVPETPPAVVPYSATVITMCGSKYGALVTDTAGDLSYYRDLKDSEFVERLRSVPKVRRWTFDIVPHGGCPVRV